MVSLVAPARDPKKKEYSRPAFFPTWSGSFICPRFAEAEIFDTLAVAYAHAERIRGAWGERRTSQVFARANNRPKPTGKKTVRAPPLAPSTLALFRSNPRRLVMSSLSFNFRQRKTRISAVEPRQASLDYSRWKCRSYAPRDAKFAGQPSEGKPSLIRYPINRRPINSVLLDGKAQNLSSAGKL